MAHLKRVWHVRIFPVDGHAVPGTLADHACTWGKKPARNGEPGRYRLPVPTVPLACLQLAVQRCKWPQFPRLHPPIPRNGTNDRLAHPQAGAPTSPTRQPIKSKSWPARQPAAPAVPKRLSSTQPTPSGALRPLPTPTRVPGRNGPEAGVMRDARCAIYTRQPRQLLALLCSRSHSYLAQLK